MTEFRAFTNWSRLFVGLLMISVVCFSQAEIVPAARLTDWSQAGIPGGIPDTSSWPVYYVTNYGAVGDGMTDCGAAVSNAVAAVPLYGRARILFTDGNFYMNMQPGQIIVQRKSIEFCGLGPTRSRILCISTNGAPNLFFFGGSSVFSIDSIPITNGLFKGSSTVSVSNINGFAVGDLILMDQLNDTNGTYTGYPVTCVGSQSSATWASRKLGSRLEGQHAIVTAISGNELSFAPPLTSTFYPQLAPQICQQSPNFQATNCGIRGLYIENVGTPLNDPTNINHQVQALNVAYFWVTNCIFNKSQNGFLYLRHSVFGEICGNVISNGIVNLNNRNYGIEYGEATTRFAAYNNILGPNLREPCHAEWGANGCVFAYNYSVGSPTGPERPNQGSPGTAGSDYNGSHGGGARLLLWEGNKGDQFRSDFLMGSSAQETLLRNYLYGPAPGGTNGSTCVDIQAYSEQYNVVGNILGSTNYNFGNISVYPTPANFSIPYVATIGYPSSGYPVNGGDTNVFATLIWHGNYLIPFNVTNWDASIADHWIPASYAYPTGAPSWWGSTNVCPWPPIGPDLKPMVGMIPAEARFNAMGKDVPRPPLNLQVLGH